MKGGLWRLPRCISAPLIAGVLAVGCSPSPSPSIAPPREATQATQAAPVASVQPSRVVPTEVVTPAAAALTPSTTVRMGVLGILAESGVYVALERGYFAEEGLAPEFTTLDTGARAIPAIAAGQLDLTGGGFSPSYINAALRGVGMKMVASLQRSDAGGSGSGILVRKELLDRGLVRDWPDLRGRSVAVPACGSVNDYTLARGLQLGGLSLTDVDLVELSFPDMIPAFANGNIDAGLSTEPLTTLAADRGVAVQWRDNGEYLPGVSPAVMSYAPGFMEGQPEAARRWMIAYLRGARDYNNAFKRGEGRADVVSILVKHTTVKDPGLYDRMGVATIDPNGTLNVANIADQAAWYSEQGFTQGTLDVAGLVDNRFLDAALARLGPYQP